ncbi:hypothetical protein K7X08_006406 [Anisodus acutangulus]|uniref:WAT1-related protein n=1 Tax=Anisodus acutangulus TaxID=402998 RepID=A0A9Q1MV98_9SOLA|nr:hypothetical protein K7X08_006406 [Anisodus acutangulus]
MLCKDSQTVERRDKIQAPLFTFPILSRVFLLGLVGVTIAQNLAIAGLSYSSPIVACGAANMIPAFTFILAIFLRKTRIDVKSQESQARMIARPRLLVFTSTHENWVLGCFLFAAASLSLCIWNIIQAGTIRKYPQVMKIVFLYTLFGTIQSAIFALLMEKDLDAWRLKLNMELLVIVLTAIFGSLIRSSVQMWCMRLKGPSYPLYFKPVGIPTASTCGCLLFADTLHYGRSYTPDMSNIGQSSQFGAVDYYRENYSQNSPVVPNVDFGAVDLSSNPDNIDHYRKMSLLDSEDYPNHIDTSSSGSDDILNAEGR